jgi:hypothetical protein
MHTLCFNGCGEGDSLVWPNIRDDAAGIVIALFRSIGRLFVYIVRCKISGIERECIYCLERTSQEDDAPKSKLGDPRVLTAISSHEF